MITNLKRSRLREFSTDSSHWKRKKYTENNKEMLGSYQSTYAGKLEIPDGKSNGTRKSVWEASESIGCDLRDWSKSIGGGGGGGRGIWKCG